MKRIPLPIDLEKCKQTDSEVVEKSLPPFLLANAFEMINHAHTRHVPKEWIELINVSSIVPLKGLPTDRIRSIATKLDMLCKETVKNSGANNTSEFAYGTARCILDLVKDGKINDPQNQGVLVSVRFIEEAVDFGDVVRDMKFANRIAGRIRNTLNTAGYYL